MELEISPEELKARLEAGPKPFLLDVREPWEKAIACLENDALVPMGELPAHEAGLPRDRDVVVYCHHGVRSLYATAFLRQQGIPAKSLKGGIDLWSQLIDPELPRY